MHCNMRNLRAWRHTKTAESVATAPGLHLLRARRIYIGAFVTARASVTSY